MTRVGDRGRRSARTGPAVSEPERRQAREARRARAHSELFDVSEVPAYPYLLLRVGNPIRGTRYQVHLPTGPEGPEAVCECPDFGQRGLGTCKHLEAARLWLSDHPVLDRAPPVDHEPPWTAVFWSAFDSAVAEGRTSPNLPWGLRNRLGGRLLFDPAPRETPTAKSRGPSTPR